MSWAHSTFFVSTSTAGRRSLLQKTTFAELFIDTLRQHQAKRRFDVHAFVVMPDHVHVLLTLGADVTLERAMTFIKGTFSFRMKKELGYGLEIWSEGYFDERIRSAEHAARVIAYIERNPVARGLSSTAQGFPFSSASGGWRMSSLPQWLKPGERVALFSAT